LWDFSNLTISVCEFGAYQSQNCDIISWLRFLFSSRYICAVGVFSSCSSKKFCVIRLICFKFSLMESLFCSSISVQMLSVSVVLFVYVFLNGFSSTHAILANCFNASAKSTLSISIKNFNAFHHTPHPKHLYICLV
jgi:hypothetical protein